MNLIKQLEHIPANEQAKRALQIAIEGKHSILFIGNEPAKQLARFAKKQGLTAYGYQACPCGNLESNKRACTCSPKQLIEYQKKTYLYLDTDLIVKTSDISAEKAITGIKKLYPELDKDCLNIIKIVYVKMDLTYHQLLKLMKVAKTISGLCGESKIKSHHIAEASQYKHRGEL